MSRQILRILEKRNGFDLKATKPISIGDYRSLTAVIAADGISYFDAQI